MWKKQINSISLGIYILVILPFLILCFFVRPVIDDFAYAGRDIDLGWLEAVKDTYMNFSNRYFATLLSNCNPLEYDYASWMYSLGSVLIISLFVFSARYAVKGLFGKLLSCMETFSLSAMFVVTYIVLCPSISECFYWFSSYTAYTVSIILFLVFLGLLPRKNSVAMLLKVIIVIAVIGSNEVSAVLLWMLLLYILLIHHGTQWRQPLVLFCVSTLMMAVIVFCPGNFVRMNGQMSTHPWLFSLLVSLLQTMGWFLRWLPVLLLSFAFYIYIIGTRVARLQIFNRSFSHFILFFTVSVILAHIPPTLGLNTVMIGRTANSLLAFFIAGSFFGFNILLHRYQDQVDEWLQSGVTRIGLLWVSASFVLVVIFAADGNVITAYTDIVTGDAYAYSAEQDARMDQLSHSAAHTDVILEPIDVCPVSLFVGDISDDEHALINENFANFHHLKSVKIREKTAVDNKNNFDRLKQYVKKMR